MTGTDLCVNKLQFVPVIFEPPCIIYYCGRIVAQLVEAMRWKRNVCSLIPSGVSEWNFSLT
jgi:hypothetical protein